MKLGSWILWTDWSSGSIFQWTISVEHSCLRNALESLDKCNHRPNAWARCFDLWRQSAMVGNMSSNVGTWMRQEVKLCWWPCLAWPWREGACKRGAPLARAIHIHEHYGNLSRGYFPPVAWSSQRSYWTERGRWWIVSTSPSHSSSLRPAITKSISSRTNWTNARK